VQNELLRSIKHQVLTSLLILLSLSLRQVSAQDLSALPQSATESEQVQLPMASPDDNTMTPELNTKDLLLLPGLTGHAVVETPVEPTVQERAPEVPTPVVANEIDDFPLSNVKKGREFHEFDAGGLGPKISDSFEGALLVCAPYCELVSVRLKGAWSVPLKGIKLPSDQMKLIDKNDPLFLALVGTPDDPSRDKDKNVVAPLASNDTAKSSSSSVDMKDRESEKDHESHWRLGLNLRRNSLSLTTNSNIQSNFSPKANYNLAQLELGYFRPNVAQLWRARFDLEVDVSEDIFSTGSSLTTGAVTKLQDGEIAATWWTRMSPFAVGLKFSRFSELVNVSNNDINAFSFSETSYLAGIAIRYHRLRFDYDTAVSMQLSEAQPFRDQLLNTSLNRMTLSYCTSGWSVGSTLLTPCLSYSQLQAKNSATLAPQFNSHAITTLQRAESAIVLGFVYGGDFRP